MWLYYKLGDCCGKLNVMTAWLVTAEMKEFFNAQSKGTAYVDLGVLPLEV